MKTFDIKLKYNPLKEARLEEQRYQGIALALLVLVLIISLIK